MISIVLIGTGNVARQLFDTFRLNDEIDVVQVLGRNKIALAYFGQYSKISTNFDKLESADIYIIAVSDEAIIPVSQLFTSLNGIVVHTSGSVPIQVLSQHRKRGVIYPLQTFSKERKINFRNVPICLESVHKADMEVLKRLAHLISDKVYEVLSERRKSLHLAAVFVNNFTNHMYQIGNSICEENKVPFEILKPLIRETAAKIEHFSPYDAQTGPARRGDDKIVSLHLSELNRENHKKIYKILSNSIKEEYQEKKDENSE